MVSFEKEWAGLGLGKKSKLPPSTDIMMLFSWTNKKGVVVCFCCRTCNCALPDHKNFFLALVAKYTAVRGSGPQLFGKNRTFSFLIES